MKLPKRLADMNAIRAQPELTNGVLVSTAAFLNHGDCLSHFALRLEVAKHENVIGQIADVCRSLNGAANNPHLRQYHQRNHTTMVQIGEQLVQMQCQELFAGHRMQKSVEAVDHHGAGVLILDGFADQIDKFARRHFCGIKMIDLDESTFNVRQDPHVQTRGALNEGIDGFFEEKNACGFPTFSGAYRPSNRGGGFTAAGRTEQKSAGAEVQPSANQLIEFRDSTFDTAALCRRFFVFGSNQPRINNHASGANHVVVEAFAEGTAA